MVSETGPRVVRSNSCKGPVYTRKGPNENFGPSKCYLGLGANLATLFKPLCNRPINQSMT